MNAKSSDVFDDMDLLGGDLPEDEEEGGIDNSLTTEAVNEAVNEDKNEVTATEDEEEGGIDNSLTTEAVNEAVNEDKNEVTATEDEEKAVTLPSKSTNKALLPPNASRQIVNDLFSKTGYKIEEDDPLVLMMLHNAELLKTTEHDLIANLKSLHDDLMKGVKNKHTEGIAEFNDQIKYLESILNKLEDQKIAIVQDVWSKSQDIMYDRTLKTMQKSVDQLIRTSSGKVSNERSVLIGAMGGLILGLILGVVIVALT